MRIDLTKTVDQNLTQLMNARLGPKFVDGDFTFGVPAVITPSDLNGQSNTQIVPTWVGGKGVIPSATSVQYNRNTLAGEYPSAPNLVVINNATTVAQVKAKIALDHKLLVSELSFAVFPLPNGGGGAFTASVSPIANSKLYAPGTLDIEVRNDDTAAWVFDGNFLLSGTDLPTDSTDIRNLKTSTKMTRSGDVKVKDTAMRFMKAKSIFFDGAGDRLTLPIADVGNLQSGDFRIESQFYPVSIAGVQVIIAQCSQQTGLLAHSWFLGTSGAAAVFFFGPFSTSTNILSGGTVVVNQWNQLTVTRQGSSWTLLLNGDPVATATSAVTGTAQPTIPLQLGNYYGATGVFPATGVNDLSGYLDQVAVWAGTAKTVGAFTPIQLDRTLASTPVYHGQFLMLADNLPTGSTDIRNMKSGKLLTRFGDVKVSQAQKAFGTGSVLFDGTGDRLSFPSTELAGTILTGDFTIEMWYYRNLLVAAEILFAQWQQSDPATSFAGFILRLNAGKPEFYFRPVTQFAATLAGATALSLGALNHIAVTRQGNTFRLFVGGTIVATATNAAVGAAITVPYSIANYFSSAGTMPASSTGDISGYIDSMGVDIGFAKYTANFTPAAII